MSNNFHNAAMQANAVSEASRRAVQGARDAARMQISYDQSIMEAREARLAECIESFASLDESSLFHKSDKDLAHFQATHPTESPQYALALHEWNRRLVARQIKATQHAAWIGLAGVIVGAVMGWFLSSANTPNPPQKEQNTAGSQPSQQHQRPNPDEIPPKAASEPQPE